MTDTGFEKETKRSLWGLFNVTVEEGTDLSANAPTNMLNIFENGRVGLYNILYKQSENLKNMSVLANGPLSNVWYVVSLFLSLLGFATGYVIIFYPIIIILLYYFFTSRLFRPKYDFDY
jgi:hypothetical protein